MALLLILLFIVIPIAELAILIQVGSLIGVWWTIALLIADSVLGAMLMRSQGRAAWRRFNDAVRSARVPAREVADGVLVIFGGALLLTPSAASSAAARRHHHAPSRTHAPCTNTTCMTTSTADRTSLPTVDVPAVT